MESPAHTITQQPVRFHNSTRFFLRAQCLCRTQLHPAGESGWSNQDKRMSRDCHIPGQFGEGVAFELYDRC